MTKKAPESENQVPGLMLYYGEFAYQICKSESGKSLNLPSRAPCLNVLYILLSNVVFESCISDFHSFWPIRQYRRCQTFTRFGQRTLQPFTRFCQIWIRKPPERMSYFYSFRPGLRMRRHTNNIQRRVSKNFSCHRIYISERSILPRREHKVPYYEISENIEKIRYA